MNKKLIVALAIGVCISVGTFMLAGDSSPANGSNESKQGIADIKTNADDPVPDVTDNEDDKDPAAIKKTKELAIEFMKHYATLKPEKPMDYLEHVEDITQERLYTILSNSQRRPTAAEHKRIVREVEIYPIEDVVPERKKWNVIVVADKYNSDGEKEKIELSYLVTVSKKTDEWEVSGIKAGY